MSQAPSAAGGASSTPAGAAAFAPETTQKLVRQAARAIGRHGLAHAYGHCSQRLDARHFLVCASAPMGLIRHEPGTVVCIDDDALPPGVLGEVRIHREIYKRRPEVGGIVRSMPPKIMSLSALRRTPRMVHGMSAYFASGVALWDDPQLVRSDAQATAVAELMGASQALVMRGNGTVVAGSSLMDAVVLTWYLEDAARIEIDCAAMGGDVALISNEEAARRATKEGRIFERMWDYLTAGDLE